MEMPLCLHILMANYVWRDNCDIIPEVIRTQPGMFLFISEEIPVHKIEWSRMGAFRIGQHGPHIFDISNPGWRQSALPQVPKNLDISSHLPPFLPFCSSFRLTLTSARSLALVACILLPWLDADLTTAASRLGGSEIGAEERLRIWRAAILMLRDFPLFGIGFRQFGWHHFELNGQMPEPRMLGFTDHAHNLLLHVLAEFGLVGFALLAGFALLWVAGLVRQPRTPAHWWIWAVALVLGVHSMLEYPLWYAFFLGVTAVVLGLGEPHTLRLQLGQSGRIGRLLLVGLLALAWFVAGQLVRDYMVLENFLAFRYRYMHASAELNRQAKDALLEIHRGSLLAQYVELGLARTISVDTDRLADKFAVNSRAMRLFPIDDVTYRQAMLLALRGDQAAARRQWDLAVASFPELRESATLVVKRRVEDGLAELRPLLEYAQKPNHHEPAEGGAN